MCISKNNNKNKSHTKTQHFYAVKQSEKKIISLNMFEITVRGCPLNDIISLEKSLHILDTISLRVQNTILPWE